MAEEKQESQKTVVSFIVGLLIGGLLVWAFSGPSANAPEDKKEGDKKEVVDENKDKKESAKEVKTEEGKVTEEVKKEEVKVSLPVGEGKIVVNSQPAGSNIKLESATYPVKEGWIGVRDYQGGNLGGILGVVRFSEEQGLVPTEIILQRPTVVGKEYAVVVYEESGDRKFNIADDKQIDKIFTTFKVE